LSGTIGFYADPAFQSSAGIERYARTLIKGFLRRGMDDRMVFLTTREDWAEQLRAWGASRVATSRIPFRALRYSWSLAGWPAAERMAGGPLVMVHNPTTMRMPTRLGAELVTVHDLFSLRHPSLLSTRQKLVLTRTLESRAARTASHIIAISQSTKNDIVELLGYPGRSISVVHLGVDHERFRPPADASLLEEIRSRYSLAEQFVLYVGSLYSRKLGRLLDAFRIVAADHPRVELVIVGGRESTAAGDSPLSVRLRELGLEGRVRVTGPVPGEDVPRLMAAASVFVYVSFYEGFGLSPLEALACGAPVVASRISSLPEVVGEAGLLVDPQDPDEIAGAISSVLDHPALAEQLRSASIAQAARFTWDRTVAETVRVYEHVLAGNAR